MVDKQVMVATTQEVVSEAVMGELHLLVAIVTKILALSLLSVA